jgi:hypothetical protein
MSKFVRLKPYNPRRGFVTQRHGRGDLFFIGGIRPNWYEVDDDVAEELAKDRQFHNDPDSKPLFDIMSKEDKEQVAAEEQNQVLAQLGAVGQTVLLPNGMKDPKTVDLTEKSAKGEKKAGGRASAIPQPRKTRKSKTRGGAVTTGDLKGDGDGDGEG